MCDVYVCVNMCLLISVIVSECELVFTNERVFVVCECVCEWSGIYSGVYI